MAWLMREGEVLAALEIADSRKESRRGLLGRDGIDGALLLRGVRVGVHTLGMRFEIDVAFCDADMVVLRTVCMAPWRLGRPSPRARCAIEAESGAFERWRLRPGDKLEVKE
jgi:uncharacterized membrane protein (UPF0127 family)